MTTTIRANAGMGARFHSFFKPRDVFLHDGKSLRRFTIGSRIQIAVVGVAFAILAWSAFATFEMIATMNGDVAMMQRQVAQMQTDIDAIRTATVQRAALLERRQAFLAEMLSGHANPDRLAQYMPAAATDFDNPAAQAITTAFNRVDSMQGDLVDRTQALARQTYRQRAVAVRQLGFEPGRFHQAEQGVGGPYEPVPAVDNADPRFRELFTTWRQLDQLQQGVAAIPSAFPLHNAVNFTSGFGVRSDPFRGRAAMHPGIDLAGPLGTPVYATADGVVDRSEWNSGGYGNLVEIDHGQGIQTRYGHLSQRIALPGQRVHRGDLIGLMGSTGRSTGSHLHYEVRIDGSAVNPVPFLQASSTFIAMQRGAAIGAPAAIGGPAGGLH
jgi:murein DD-endopeptidase MepM/ murein hydrolase activator NlpD